MEPERKIEKLLRAFAKKRRDQTSGDLKLDPVARRQLQDEVSRLASKKSESGLSFFAWFRPRIAFAAGFLVIVVASAWLLWPALNGNKPREVASGEKRVEESKVEPAQAPTLAPPPVAAREQDKIPAANRKAVSDIAAVNAPQQTPAPKSSGTIASRPEGQAAVSSESLALGVNSDEAKLRAIGVFDDLGGKAQTNSWTEPVVASTAQPAPVLETPPPAAAPVMAMDSFAANIDRDGDSKSIHPASGARTATTAPAASATLAKRNELAEGVSPVTTAPGSVNGVAGSYQFKKTEAEASAAVASQRFYRIDAPVARQRPAAAFSGGAAPVLASFQFEQNGKDLRVVDGDGSVYTGVLETTQDGLKSDALFSGTQKQSQVQNYFFRVEGTNRSLKEKLLFSGNLIPLTNSPARGGAVGGASASRAPSAATQPFSNVRISGKAVIGDQKEIEVNATPAP